MKQHLMTIVGAIITLCCLHLHGQSTGSIDPLKSNSFAQRKAEIELLEEQRDQSIKSMIAVLNGNSSPDIKDSVAIVLGNCRAAQAVDALMQNIHLDVRGRIIKGFLTEDEMFPVTTSLEKIGNPSIPAIIKYLGEKGRFLESGTEEQRRATDASALLLRALCHIDGDKDIVRLRLQKALAAQHDPQEKARLQSALDALAKM